MSQTLTTSLAVREDLRVVHHIRIVSGPDAGVEAHPITAPSVLGTSPNADLQLTDPSVSSLHCELRPTDEGLVVRDLGSKNGIWAGGCRLREALLVSGSRIQLGNTALEASAERKLSRLPVWCGPDRFGELLGGSLAMRDLYTRLAVAAQADSPVLLIGETGTGKELAARAIHESSSRAAGPFITVDPGMLTPTLASSELFGHVAGAFTGAHRDHVGAFEAASGGTLFLDELGDLEPQVQVKLLRAVELGEIAPVGGESRRLVDVRIISATHPTLLAKVAARTFREDLYYRLAVLTVELPPLRDRGPDIVVLARSFAEQVCGTQADRAEQTTAVESAITARAGYAWPGNVRELRSFVRRMVLLGEPATMGPDTVQPRGVQTDLPWADARAAWLSRFEREYLEWLVHHTGGNITLASKLCGLSRSRIYELLEKHRLT